MDRFQRVVNAAIVSLLVKPLARRLVARTRRRAVERARTTIIVPAQALLQAVPFQVPAADVVVEPAGEEPSDRDIVRALAIAAVIATIAAAITLAIAVLLRSRRKAAADMPVEASAPRVVIPVGLPGQGPALPHDAEATDADVTAIDPSDRDPLRSIRGVGPETAQRLRDVGISRLEQVAEWDDDSIDRIGGQIETDPERIRSEDWVGQARAAIDAASAAA